mgnify:CR=1 FL=1
MPRKIKLFSGDDIDDLYYEVTKAIVTEGTTLKFGSQREVKYARELFIVLQVYGKAIIDILAGKTPKGFVWSGKKIKELQRSFIEDILNPAGFEYTYGNLLKRYPMSDGTYFDQLYAAKEALAYDVNHDIQGNRIVGVIYHPMFNDTPNKPCFGYFQVRYLGNNKVSLVLFFRSHDYGSALFGNLCSIAYAFNYFVIAPNLCTLDEIIVVSTSGHIYENDSQLAEEIPGIKWNVVGMKIDG